MAAFTTELANGILLARRAGVRPETLNRIEHGENTPSIPTIAKIDKALKEAAALGGQ